jgi:hypothetical protein
VFGPHALAWRDLGEVHERQCGRLVTRGDGGLPAVAGGSGDGPLLSVGSVGSVGWGGGEAAGGAAGQLPAAVVDRSVVGPAQQGQVGQVGGATVQPVPEVVALAPGQGSLAVGEATAAVADGQGAALGGGDDPAGSAEVQGLAGGAAEDWGQPGQGGLEPVGQAPLAMGVLPGLGAVVAGLAAMVLGGVAADQDPGQGPVTGQPVTGLGFQGPGPAALTPKGGLVAEQAVQIDGDQTLGRTPPVWGSWPPSRVRRASSARASARR